MTITPALPSRPWLTLSKGCSSRGADMGRITVLPVDPTAPIRFHLQRLRLDSGGYDAGGAYWGIGHRALYRAVSTTESTVAPSWARHDGFRDSGSPYQGRAEWFARADTRNAAKDALRALVPGATFYR